MQIRYVNRALQRFDSTQVIPVQFVLFTISVIIGSAILYRDFQSANADRFGKFFGGCALTFLGVYLITSGRTTDRDNEDIQGVDDDEESAIGLVDEERHQDEIEYAGRARDARRRSSASAVFDEDTFGLSSRRSSRQKPNHQSRPLTPPPLLSHISTPSGVTSPSDDLASPTLTNPWQSEDSLTRPQAHGNVVSAPHLPSEARRSKPSTLSRRSVARLTPGPLMSPLSSSLSAVVADSLRKSVDSPSARTRPRLSVASSSKSQGGRRNPSESATVTDFTPLRASQRPEEASESENSGTIGRPRSFSIAVGEFLGFKREQSGKSKDHMDDSDGQ